MPYWLIFIACGLALFGYAVMAARRGDYRNRWFYRKLYSANIFDLIVFGWKLLGAPGSWIFTRTIALGYALSHPTTLAAVRSNLALFNPKKAGFFEACKLFINQAECISTFGRFALAEPGTLKDLLGEKYGFEHLKKAHESGKGCLLVTGHFGFFEMGGLVMAELGFPVTALTLPEPYPELTQWRADFRARWGVKTVVVGKDVFSVVEIVRAINAGAFVATLIDRPYDGSGVKVPVPHGHILFSSAPVLISLLANCPIVPVGISTQADGKYRIDACAPIHPQWLEAGRTETLEHFTQKIAEELVPLFGQAPEQWYHFSPMACRV